MKNESSKFLHLRNWNLQMFDILNVNDYVIITIVGNLFSFD